MAGVSRGLFELPNELLREIAALLGPPGVRRLSQINHRLLDFAFDYSRPYASRLAALPDDIVLGVIAYLRDNDRGRIARTSWRFYPLVMDAVIHEEVRTHRGKLMGFAMMKSRKGLARRLLQAGADVDILLIFEYKIRSYYFEDAYSGFYSLRGYHTTSLSYAVWHSNVDMAKLLLKFGAQVHALCLYVLDPKTGLIGHYCTPLLLAVHHGHEYLVELLLQAGASPIAHGKLETIFLAIKNRSENIVLQLLRALKSANELSGLVIKELFRMASEGNLRSLSSNVISEHERIILRQLPPIASIEEHQEDDIAEIMGLAVAGKLPKLVEYCVESSRP
jgi:ankyrin repeat protein